ncbi:hypothetical protein [Natronorubrum halophilum]|uniref:hypothetical protein n=1 Tax=Natronorubrum halophilum TaxID=1702106 RepID=UPI000EF7490F|nr:hypothetical protein [Natronorubrum halophilum]
MSDEFHALERQADAMEQQTAALEAIATELRYQNAALVETIDAIDQLATHVDDREGELMNGLDLAENWADGDGR